MLADRVRVEQRAGTLEAEDIFADAAAIFPDDTRTVHGDPGATIFYRSRFGDVRLSMADPGSEDDRQLFAHYLWNAGVFAADQMEQGVWNVRGKTVLELGAGMGLCGIIAALCGAAGVVLSDYPAKAIIENLTNNVKTNVSAPLCSTVTVASHAWGQVDDELATSHPQSFTVILAADCYWRPHLHRDLARSMLHFLSNASHARVYAIAGFHTGRAKLAPFFDVAAEEGLSIESIEEIDVFGDVRPWAKERDGGREDVTERKRWLAVAVLKRKSSPS